MKKLQLDAHVANRSEIRFQLNNLKNLLPSVVVKGVKTVITANTIQFQMARHLTQPKPKIPITVNNKSKYHCSRTPLPKRNTYANQNKQFSTNFFTN